MTESCCHCQYYGILTQFYSNSENGSFFIGEVLITQFVLLPTLFDSVSGIAIARDVRIQKYYRIASNSECSTNSIPELNICSSIFHIFGIFGVETAQCLMSHALQGPSCLMLCYRASRFVVFIVKGVPNIPRTGCPAPVADIGSASPFAKGLLSAGITRTAPKCLNLKKGTMAGGAASYSTRFIQVDR